MKVADVYSHFNGLEYLLVRKPALWEEVCSIISQVDLPSARTRRANRTAMIKTACSFVPNRITCDLSNLFQKNNWDRLFKPFANTKFHEREHVDPRLQRRIIGVSSYNQTDFVKDRVAVEVQFGKYAFVAFDLFVKHLLFYSGDVIDVGVEILPMKEMLQDAGGGRRMSTGIAYFEGEVYNILRHGRNSPPVPLLILGIAP